MSARSRAFPWFRRRDKSLAPDAYLDMRQPQRDDPPPTHWSFLTDDPKIIERIRLYNVTKPV